MKLFSRLLPSSFDPLKLAALGICAWAALLGSCSQTPVTVNLHAMQSSENVSYVCRGADNSPTGHKLDECPEYESGSRHTLALVTQVATNEVAVVDLYAQSILDIDRTTPGYSFLRVGATPGAIVTTPGGAATFVGVRGLEKDGIFALPTTCLLPPVGEEPARDLTTWAACHLRSPPGDIKVLVDPLPRTTCPNAPPLRPTTPRVDDACPADLTAEPGPAGRRKLLVALPKEHKLVLLDAQHLLDQQPGSFGECEPEASFALDVDVPNIPLAPVIPADLTPNDDAMCTAVTYPAHPAQSASAPPTPGGLALMGDRVYVADETRPLVHVLDVSDPCTDKELPPLLPRSYTTPDRVVTTSRLAVSPLSPGHKQFVYAIDQDDQPTASVMVFDLARIVEHPGDADFRTPVVFEGGPRQPNMAPDRLRFISSVKDVSFVMRDFPKPDPITGAGEFGLSCEPDPNASGPGTEYRPNPDYTDGARPVNLRGLFGFALLTSGQIAVIDVEDFDQACRRPVTTNQSSTFVDLHGCWNDPTSAPYTRDGQPTVTGESSCNIVEAHRPRSASLSISSSSTGIHAPSLRAFPQFSTPGSTVPLQSQPRMMATDFANPDDAVGGILPAEVNINTQLYVHCTDEQLRERQPPCDGSAQPLGIDPKQDVVQNSLTLPLIEPRSYAQDEAPTLVFEGRLLTPDRTSGFLHFKDGASEGVVSDPDANFCGGAGVEDSDTIAERGAKLGIPAANLKAWSDAHADYVQITGDYPADDNPYWFVGKGQRCAEFVNPNKADVNDRDACIGKFGGIDNLSNLYPSRNLTILQAYAGELTVQPRNCQGAACAETLAALACCFPSGTAYTVRASNQWVVGGTNGLHDIGSGANGRCVHTAACDLRKEHFERRAFEVCDPLLPPETHQEQDPAYPDDPTKTITVTDFTCAVADPQVGCVGTSPDRPDTMNPRPGIPVLPGYPASPCIFENLTSRFVVYRGPQPSILGMGFNWQTSGGFLPQTMSLLPLSSTVSPQSLGYLPELGYLSVVDASTLGLVLFDLNSLGVVAPSPYF